MIVIWKWNCTAVNPDIMLCWSERINKYSIRFYSIPLMSCRRCWPAATSCLSGGPSWSTPSWTASHRRTFGWLSWLNVIRTCMYIFTLLFCSLLPLLPKPRGLQGDVVYLSWPIAPLVYEPKCRGGGGGLRGLSQWAQLCTSNEIEPKLTLEF